MPDLLDAVEASAAQQGLQNEKPNAKKKTKSKTKANKKANSMIDPQNSRIESDANGAAPFSFLKSSGALSQVCTSSSGVDRFLNNICKLAPSPDEPFILVYHGRHPTEDTLDLGVLSVAYGRLSTAIDLSKVQFNRVKHLLTTAAERGGPVVVPNGSVAALAGYVNASEALPHGQWYNVQLGHEMLDGTFGASLSETASAVG